MSSMKRLVREVHRRSLWQVLSIYLVGSWGALQVVDGVTENAGLPDWVPPFALVLLIIGLPIVLATAFVQEGMPGRGEDDEDGEARHEARAPGPDAPSAPAPDGGDGSVHGLLTWRNAITGGVAAFGLLGVAVALYFGMRATGVGPVASLAAQGVFDEREPVVLADFAATAADPGLARLVTEALRVDLVESTALTVLPESYILDVLRRMELPDSTVLTPEVAREIAQRDGMKAVIRGEVGQLGAGFVLTASLVEARSGQDLAAFRETVPDEAGLLDAIDKLSERIREKAGESLRQIRTGESLADVTTSSLDALRLYSDAMALSERGQEAEALALLESALEIDPDFGMAWRKVAALVGNLGSDPERRRAAATRAYQLRDRMSEVERALSEAYYFSYVEPEEQRSRQAYERVLSVKPDDPTALNNLAIAVVRQDPQRAIELLERAVNGPGATSVAHTNLVQYYWNGHRDDDARALIGRVLERYPGSQRGRLLALDLASLENDFGTSHEGRRELIGSGTLSADQRVDQEIQAAMDDAGMGRLQEGRSHIRAALDVAEAEGAPAWAVDALTAWLFVEVLGGRPGGYLPYLQRAESSGPLWSAAASPWTAAFAVTGRALAGDADGARRSLAAWEGAVPVTERTELVRGAMAWGRWSVGVATGDTQGALEAMDYIQSDVERCGDRRCWGWWDRGRALEAAGRKDEARTMYRRQLQGLATTETRWNPVQTIDALRRLAALAEEAGDAAEAAEAYGRFAELWAGADADLQPLVAQAREKAAALGGG